MPILCRDYGRFDFSDEAMLAALEYLRKLKDEDQRTFANHLDKHLVNMGATSLGRRGDSSGEKK